MPTTPYSIKTTRFEPGTILNAKYKGGAFRVETRANPNGDGVVYVTLHDDAEHKTLSAAGKHICNGATPAILRFFKVEGEESASYNTAERARGTTEPKPKTARAPRQPKEPKEAKPKAEPEPKTATARKEAPFKNLKRMRDQTGAPDGKIRWWCSSCQDGFLADYGESPATCPQNHPATATDDFTVEESGAAAVIVDDTADATPETAAEAAETEEETPIVTEVE